MAHGNIINRVQENIASATPVVGMGATQICYSDRHAFTIVGISKSGKRMTLQADTATRTDNNGMSDCQTYSFAANPNGALVTVSLRKDGRWREVGGSSVFLIGRRSEYHDYSF